MEALSSKEIVHPLSRTFSQMSVRLAFANETSKYILL